MCSSSREKIVSKSEGRYVRLADIEPSAAALELAKTVGKDPRFIEVVLGESDEIVKHRPNVLIAGASARLRHGQRRSSTSPISNTTTERSGFCSCRRIRTARRVS